MGDVDQPSNLPPLWQRLGEIALICLVFQLFAGGLPPGEDEPHYLCKAKHYWDPAWCRDDLFLNSADAHASFYWTFGWVTALSYRGEPISLEAAALICRVALWLVQAWAWRRLSWALIPRPLFSVLSAGLFLAVLHHGTMAREWIVGDVEAKGAGYVFVFLGLEALVRRRWHWVFPLLGAAAAFHVIVGGWAVVAAGVAWLVLRRMNDEDTPRLLSLIPSLVLGFVLTLPGLVPCLLLDRGTPPETVAEGTVIYVYARLSHHLVISRFETLYIVRHVALICGLLFTGWLLRHDKLVRPLLGFVAGAVLLEIVGVAIDQSLVSASDELRAKLLRYYWYRLGDAMVPVTLSLLLCRLVALPKLPASVGDKPEAGSFRHGEIVRTCTAAAMLALATWNIVDLLIHRPAGVPEGNYRLKRNNEAVVSLLQRHHDWVACCDWIRTRTDSNATFLTPRRQQTFLWYAQRAEVVNWKNCPQDARSVVAWLKRFEDVFPDPGGKPILYGPGIDPHLPREQRLMQVGRKYHAQYVVIDHTEQTPPALPRVYPTGHDSNGDDFNLSFSVYRLPHQ